MNNNVQTELVLVYLISWYNLVLVYPKKCSYSDYRVLYVMGLPFTLRDCLFFKTVNR